MHRRLTVGAIATVAVVVAIALGALRHVDHTAAAPSRPPAQTMTTVATAATANGASHDVNGAVATVVAWEQRSATLVTGTEADLTAAESAIGADATRQQLVAANTDQFRRLRAALPADGLSYRIAVVATRATAHDVDAVQVTVWRVGVLTVVGRGSSAEWATVTDELVWEHDGWRLLTETSTPGPVPPAGAVTPPAELTARVDAMTPAVAR
jgi:hypothetical protein